MQDLQQENERLLAQLERANFSRRVLKRRISSLIHGRRGTLTASKPDAYLLIECRRGDGEYTRSCVYPAADDLDLLHSRLLCLLPGGTRVYGSNEDGSAIAAVLKNDYELVYQLPCAERQAAFRLGQLDMQSSICDMLRELADGAADPVSAGLILAADLVEGMEVPYANA